MATLSPFQLGAEVPDVISARKLQSSDFLEQGRESFQVVRGFPFP
jgi:hypothetical protein